MGASMGSFLPQAATPGYRLMMPYSQMMIHSLSYGVQGKREDHTRSVGQTRNMMAAMYEVYVDKMAEARVLFGGKEDTPELRGEILRWLFEQMEDDDVFMSPLQTLDADLTDFVVHSEAEHSHSERSPHHTAQPQTIMVRCLLFQTSLVSKP